MLKRKQTEVRLASYGFFLLTTPAITAITQDTTYAINATSYYEAKAHSNLFADTASNKAGIYDTLNSSASNAFSEKKMAKAPAVRLNSNATKFVKEYVSKNSSCLSKIKDRSDDYFTVMDKVFNSYSLPLQLKYLAVIESELKLKAVSHVGAVGLWQLMPGTARELGLKVSSKCDERRLCYKSTKAAAMYLNDLYKQFGDWLLVIAAYNSGPGPVYSAIKKSGSRNFWRLQHYLPTETKLHVKRFIGTHYYFEGGGSVTTLTKAEATEHLRAVAKFMEELKEVEDADLSTSKKDLSLVVVE